MYRPRDVLDLLLAQVVEPDIELVADMVVHRPRHANSARVGQDFEPRRDIDPVTINVAAVDDDVAEIDADAELNARFGRHPGITPRHLPLQFDRAAHRVDDAGELNE